MLQFCAKKKHPAALPWRACWAKIFRFASQAPNSNDVPKVSTIPTVIQLDRSPPTTPKCRAVASLSGSCTQRILHSCLVWIVHSADSPQYSFFLLLFKFTVHIQWASRHHDFVHSFLCWCLACEVGLQFSVDRNAQVENGDMNWIIPDKFLAFAGPSPTSTDADGFLACQQEKVLEQPRRQLKPNLKNEFGFETVAHIFKLCLPVMKPRFPAFTPEDRSICAENWCDCLVREFLCGHVQSGGVWCL